MSQCSGLPSHREDQQATSKASLGDFGRRQASTWRTGDLARRRLTSDRAPRRVRIRMPPVTTRTIDGCAPLFVWPPGEASGRPERSHGVAIETRFEHDTLARTSLPLRLRATEASSPATLLAATSAVTVTCSLETGACTPIDHDAARFLHERRWLADAIRGELRILRDRAARAAAQADRETAARHALAEADSDAMIPYDELFPADWDLLVTRAGEHYWAADLHCPGPSCNCSRVVVTFYRLDDSESARFVGDARIDVAEPIVRVMATSSKEIADIVERLVAKHGDELRARYDEARRAVRRFGRARPLRHGGRAPAVLQAGRVSRNAPCPCGSGKKYKRCCIDTRAGASSRP